MNDYKDCQSFVDTNNTISWKINRKGTHHSEFCQKWAEGSLASDAAERSLNNEQNKILDTMTVGQWGVVVSGYRWLILLLSSFNYAEKKVLWKELSKCLDDVSSKYLVGR